MVSPDDPNKWPDQCRFHPHSGGISQGGQQWCEKGVTFDNSIILVIKKLVDTRGSHDKVNGVLSQDDLKGLDRHPLSPWQSDTGVTEYAEQDEPVAHEVGMEPPKLSKQERRSRKKAKITRTLRMRAKGSHKKASAKLIQKLMDDTSSSSETEESEDLT